MNPELSISFEQRMKVWKEYGTAMAPLTPVIALFLFGEGLVWLNNVNPQIVLYFLGTGIISTIVWLLFDLLKSRSDFIAFMDIHNVLEPIDRDAQTEIYEGLLELRIIDEEVPDDTERLMRRAANDIAIQSLIPSAYHNHHAKELVEYGMKEYVDRKKRLAHRAFSMADISYRQLVTNRLPKGMAFDDAVESFVCRWIRREIIPAVRTACTKKISYYSQLSEQGHISRGFKAKIAEWKAKNEKYIAALDELMAHSSIIQRSDA